MMEFDGKVLMLGYGSVAQCALPVMLDHVKIPYGNITILDFEDKEEALREWTAKGVKFVRDRVTPANLGTLFAAHLSPGDLLVDLAWNIDCCEIVQWCHDHQVFYVNTSVEQWEPQLGSLTLTPYEKSLYYRQMKLRELTRGWTDATTCVVDHGANPGLVSHFATQALVDIAARLVEDKKAKDPALLDCLVRGRRFAELAMELGVKVVHCSERDTQITDKPKEVDEFVGTWSIEGLREEGVAPAELGWGTHELELPELAVLPPDGPVNQIFLARMGMNTWVHSWVPGHDIVGMVIRHGEAFGISDRWTVWRDGKPFYRPTVHYAYMPCDGTIMSLQELRCRNYHLQPKLRILKDSEIVSGADILGALLMGHDYKSWWTGSVLGIEQSRRLVPGQNATTIQVAVGVTSAVMWMLRNPRRGVCLPEDLSHDFVLEVAKPYLGEFISSPYDWTPLKNRQIHFKENPANLLDHQDPWQFRNFLFIP